MSENSKNWKVTGAVVTGLSHRRENTPCQDRIAILPVEHGMNYHAAALADGVGSLQNSHIAAKLATDKAVDWLSSNRDRLFQEARTTALEKKRLNDLAAELLEEIRAVIRQQAALQSMDLRSMDCNLAFCFVDEEQDKAFVGQLGDCAVCIVCDDSDKSRSRVLNVQGYLANSTDTVQSKGSEERMNMTIVPLSEKGPGGGKLLYGFILTSDGLENVLYRKGSRYVCKQAEHCFNLDEANRAESLRELLTDAQESFDGYLDDDLSVVVLSCAEGKVTLPREPHWTCKKCGAENLGVETRCHQCAESVLTMYPKADLEKVGAEAYFDWLSRQKTAKSSEGTKAAEPQTKNGEAERRSRKETKNETGEVNQSNKQRGTLDLTRMGNLLKVSDPTAEPASGGPAEGGYQGDPPGEGTGLGTKIIFGVLITATAALLALLLFLGYKAMTGDEDPPASDPVQSTGTVDPGVQDPTNPSGEGIRLADGTVFFGRLIGGMPDGYGTLIDEKTNTVSTGVFVQGRKDGVFTITTLVDGEVVTSVILYEFDEVKQIYYGNTSESGPAIGIVVYGVRLYQVPNYDGQPVKDADGNMVRLQENDQVYLTEEESVDINGNKWRKIETQAGITGWCEDGAIRLIVQEESSGME